MESQDRKLRGGDHHYRAFVGHPGRYDTLAGLQFSLLLASGLREQHNVLDIGCGSLRVGRLLIPYLAVGHYFGIEPEEWLVEQGIDEEVGRETIERRQPSFLFSTEYDVGTFGVAFDRILAHSVFTHAPAGDVERCLANVAAAMSPDGAFYATFLIGKQDYDGETWRYPELVAYSPRWIKQAGEAAGLRAMMLDWPHPHRQRWVLFTPAGASRSARRDLEVDARFLRSVYGMRARRTPIVRALARGRRGSNSASATDC